jgi:predicted component of type VI protein secretion system
MQVTYAQLFKFMGTFTNQELDDAQTIAKYAHQDLGKSYNQVLVDVLVEMRQHQLIN